MRRRRRCPPTAPRGPHRVPDDRALSPAPPAEAQPVGESPSGRSPSTARHVGREPAAVHRGAPNFYPGRRRVDRGRGRRRAEEDRAGAGRAGLRDRRCCSRTSGLLTPPSGCAELPSCTSTGRPPSEAPRPATRSRRRAGSVDTGCSSVAVSEPSRQRRRQRPVSHAVGDAGWSVRLGAGRRARRSRPGPLRRGGVLG